MEMNSKRFSHFTSWYVPKIIENTHPYKKLYVSAHRSLIHHSPKVVTNQMSYSVECIDKMGYICNGILLGHKKGMKY